MGNARQGGESGAPDASSAGGAPKADDAHPYRVGVTGHRALGSAATAACIAAACHAILAEAQARHERVEAVSAIAEGADSLFAEAALALHIPLLVVVPFTGYEADFETVEARDRFGRLHAAAVAVERLDYTERSDEAYMAVGRWIADHVDLLVAVWDGQPARGLGGTADVVAHAQGQGIAVKIISVQR
jgi:hypothetical protein